MSLYIAFTPNYLKKHVVDILNFLLLRSGPRRNIKIVFPGMGISIIKIRRSRDRLISIMGRPILVRQRFLY